MVDNIPRMETIKKTHEITGISEDAIRKMIYSGQITYIKLGKKYLINVDKLVDFLNKGEKHDAL